MQIKDEKAIEVRDVELDGHAQTIRLRTYRPSGKRETLPAILFFHGGCFVAGTIEQADAFCRLLAAQVRAVVISVGYSLAPAFPFPAALQDGHCAARWVVANARSLSVDVKRLAVAGHDAGGNLAAGLAAMARDQANFQFCAQALLAPLLDPSMTRIADLDSDRHPDVNADECAFGYRAYLPVLSQRMHPYAAPIESSRLANLPAAFIASAENDLMHVEAERYAAELIAAGVPTTVTRYPDIAHNELASRREVLTDLAAFFGRKFDVTSKPF